MAEGVNRRSREAILDDINDAKEGLDNPEFEAVSAFALGCLFEELKEAGEFNDVIAQINALPENVRNTPRFQQISKLAQEKLGG